MYAKKSDLKAAIVINTSEFIKKVHLASLKSKLDKIK